MIEHMWISVVKEPIDMWARWSNVADVLVAFCTLIALGFLVYEFSKNRSSEKENQKMEEHRFWHEHLPILTVASPCDPTQNYCEINIANYSSFTGGRGNALFSLVNFSHTSAYDIEIELSSNEEFKGSNHSVKHFYSEINPQNKMVLGNSTITHYIKKERDDNSIEHEEDDFYLFEPESMSNDVAFIYSKFFIDPETRDISKTELNICDFAENCSGPPDCNEKYLYIRLKYYSAPNKETRRKIISTFKATLECFNSKQIEKLSEVRIKNIARTSYEVAKK